MASRPHHAAGLRREPDAWAAPEALGRIGTLGLGVGLVGALLLVLGYFLAPEQFFRSYLVGYTYWLGLALGSLALAMLHHLTTGSWGFPARRILEAASRTLPALAVLFVPLAFGIHSLYEWSHEEAVAAKPLIAHKVGYLNSGDWLVRAGVYFAVWLALAYLLNRWSARQDRDPSPALVKRMRVLAAPGLVLYVVTITFASMDWIMSLDPEWYSTIYGVWLLGGHGVLTFAFLIVMGSFLVRREPMAGVIHPSHFHDWGKLLLAFTLLWTYFSVSQLLIIWSANIPEEVLWYEYRLNGGWQYVGLALALLHFALPFLLLLSRDLKRDARLLVPVAVLLMVMHWVDYFWNVAPVFSRSDFTIHWLDLVAPLAIGGIWLWLFVRELRSRPLLPIGDPYLDEVLHHEH